MTSAVDDEALVRALYDAFAKGDLRGVLGVLSEDIDWTEAEGFPYAGNYRGHEAVVHSVFVKLATEWDGYQALPDRYVSAAGAVVALGNYCGTYKATGKSFRAPFAHSWTILGGKIVRFVQYTDTIVV